MKFLDEYRDGAGAQKLVRAIEQVTTRPWTIMEVCGGQTHTIVKYGIDEMLPKGIVMRWLVGGTRVVTMLAGEQLPRIC
jgi:hydrogenase expression/formation protein HypD